MLLSIAFPSQYWRKLLQNTKPQHVTKQMRPPPNTHTHTSDEQKLGMDLQNVFLDLQSKLPLDKVAGRQAAVFPPIKCHLKLLPCKTWMALAITSSSDQATTVSCDTQRCTQNLLKAMKSMFKWMKWNSESHMRALRRLFNQMKKSLPLIPPCPWSRWRRNQL